MSTSTERLSIWWYRRLLTYSFLEAMDNFASTYTGPSSVQTSLEDLVKGRSSKPKDYQPTSIALAIEHELRYNPELYISTTGAPVCRRYGGKDIKMAEIRKALPTSLSEYAKGLPFSVRPGVSLNDIAEAIKYGTRTLEVSPLVVSDMGTLLEDVDILAKEMGPAHCTHFKGEREGFPVNTIMALTEEQKAAASWLAYLYLHPDHYVEDHTYVADRYGHSIYTTMHYAGPDSSSTGDATAVLTSILKAGGSMSDGDDLFAGPLSRGLTGVDSGLLWEIANAGLENVIAAVETLKSYYQMYPLLEKALISRGATSRWAVLNMVAEDPAGVSLLAGDKTVSTDVKDGWFTGFTRFALLNGSEEAKAVLATVKANAKEQGWELVPPEAEPETEG